MLAEVAACLLVDLVGHLSASEGSPSDSAAR
jgi:hypothetical protein